MKPWIRVAQAQPTLGNRSCSMSGKLGGEYLIISSWSDSNLMICHTHMTPPSAPPHVAIPVALPLRRKNQCPTEETAGVNIMAVPKPPSTPKTSIKCLQGNPNGHCASATASRLQDD
jgi:hypothetical protein